MITRIPARVTLFLFLSVYFAYGAAAAVEDNLGPKLRFSAKTPVETENWQAESRKLLFELLKLADLQVTRQPAVKQIGFDAKTLMSEDRDKYTWSEIEINSTPTRRIKAILTVPKSADKQQKLPAVVCINGHNGN